MNIDLVPAGTVPISRNAVPPRDARPESGKRGMKGMWKAIVPVAVAVVLLLPAPPGLAEYAWRYFVIFAGAVVGLVLEPLPGGAIGLIGVTAVTTFAPYTLYSPAELARPGFSAADSALNWALTGFSNSTVWLIFTAFMFALDTRRRASGAGSPCCW